MRLRVTNPKEQGPYTREAPAYEKLGVTTRVQRFVRDSRPFSLLGNLQRWWHNLSGTRKYDVGFLSLIGASAVAFNLLMYELPQYIADTTISQTEPIFIIVSVGLLASISQIRVGWIKNWAIFLAVVNCILSLYTFVAASFQTGVKVLSTDWVTSDFKMSAMTLTLTIEFFAGGMILGRLPKQAGITPEDTEP